MHLFKNNKFVYDGSFWMMVLLMIGCSAVPEEVRTTLELSGDNRKELEKVIGRYQTSKDTLKLKAAYHLIANMRYQYFRPYSPKQESFIDELDYIFRRAGLSHLPFDLNKWQADHYEGYATWRPILISKWDSLDGVYPGNAQNPIFDFNKVTGDLLIDNIDAAFRAWKYSPWKDDLGFNTFCISVLPYRNFYDIPQSNRKALCKVFSNVKRNTIWETANAFNDTIKLHFLHNKVFQEFSHMTIADVFKVKHLTCRQQSSIKLAGLRALAVPCDQVFAVDGTSWVRIRDEKGKIYDYQGQFITNPRKDGSVGYRRGDSYAKVYMRTFDIQPNGFEGVNIEDIPPLFQSRNIKDVSKDHLITFDVEVVLKLSSPLRSNFVYLCTFSKKGLTWSAVDWALVNNGKATFTDLGKKKIYWPAYYSSNSYHPAAAPFYLDEKGIMVPLSPNKTMENVRLRRKFNWTFREMNYVYRSVGMRFEGADNPRFNNPRILAVIMKKPTHYEEIELKDQGKFRYFRIITPDTTKSPVSSHRSGLHLSRLSFIDSKESEIKGSPLSINQEAQERAKNLFDGDIRTNFDIDDQPGWVGLDAGRPVSASKVKYLIRNSHNTIEPGDTYELFYWDNQWISLGSKIAEKDHLDFSVPTNAVLWLRNRTRGKQEMIFFMKDGEQVWG